MVFLTPTYASLVMIVIIIIDG